MKQPEKIVDPQTRDEWQTAVNGAEFWLILDSAIQYGLLQMVDEKGRPMKGSGVNVDRCLQLIESGKTLGVYPDPEIIKKLTAEKGIQVQERTRYTPPGRRCALPKDYFINKLTPKM